MPYHATGLFCPPEGWEIAEDSRLKFKTVIGPSSDGFTPNINVVEMNDPRSLSDFVSYAIKYYSARAKNLGATYIKMLNQSEVTTFSKQQGIKVAFQSENKGLSLRTTQYYFSEKGDGKLIITFTALEKDSKILEPVFDHTMKTFQLDK